MTLLTTSKLSTMCIEDPISVSSQFSLKFHAFFNKIIIKEKVLGALDHYMWKKEYQNRAPYSCVAMDMRCPCHRC